MPLNRRTNRLKYVALACLAVLALAVAGFAMFRATPSAPQSVPAPVVQTPTPTPTPTVSVPAVAEVLQSSFTGTGAPTIASTGQPFGVLDGGKNTSGMAVAGGLLKHGAATGTNAASYLESGIGKPVERIAAEAVFFDKAGGQIALVAWQTSIVEARSKAAPDRIPNGGIHFVAGPTGWHLGVYDTNGGERIVQSGNLSLNPDGKTKYKFTVVRKGDTAWITLPDGGVSGPAVDPKLAEWTGEWATWELFESVPGAVPAAFASVSAG